MTLLETSLTFLTRLAALPFSELNKPPPSMPPPPPPPCLGSAGPADNWPLDPDGWMGFSCTDDGLSAGTGVGVGAGGGTSAGL